MLPDLKNAMQALSENRVDESLNALCEYLDASYSPSQIDDAVRFLITNKSRFENSSALPQLFQELQKAVSQKMLALGETPDAYYCFLYPLVSELEPDGLISETVKILQEHYLSVDSGSSEGLILRNLLFTLRTLNGDKESAFDDFFIATCASKIDEMEALTDGTILVMDLLKSFNLPFERLIKVYKQIFEPEYFFSLNKLQRRCVFAWSFHVVWNVPQYFNNLKWIELYELWKVILFKYLALELIDEAMYLHFYMHHKMGNSAQEAMQWKKFNDEIEYPCSKAYAAYAKKLNLPQCKSEVNKNGKIKIAFLKDRVVMNSPFKIEYSLLKTMQDSEEFTSKYEICVYSMNYFEKSQDSLECVKMLQEINIPLYSPAYMLASEHYYVNHLQKALVIRDAIIKDGVDILIACTNNYAIESFLFGSRSAPRQIFWSHGNVAYNVLGIDDRISHISIHNQEFEFKHINVSMDSSTFYNPHRDIEVIMRERARYPQDTFILGTIGRLVKVDRDEYLEAVAEIMKLSPNTIYIAAGVGDAQTIRNRVEKLGISDRFYMPGHVDAHIYGHIIDFWLDTFPSQGGEAVSEFSSKKKCVVQYFPPNKDLSILDNKDEMKVYTDIISGFETDAMFARLKDFNISKNHALYKIAQLLESVKEIVFVLSNNKDYKLLISQYGVDKNRLLFINEKSSTLAHKYLIDVDICLFGDNESVKSVKMKQYFSTRYRSINSKWVVLFDDTTNVPNILLEYDQCSINDLWYHNYTVACSVSEYVVKADHLIKNSDFRNRVIIAADNERNFAKAETYKSIVSWLEV